MPYIITAEQLCNHEALDELLERIAKEEEKRMYAWIDDLKKGA